MPVTYLFRSPGTGHSIETLFTTIQREVGTQESVTTVRLPHISRGIRSVWQNLRFVAQQRFNGIVHITGDVHYAVLALSGSQTVLTIHDCITLKKNQNRPLRFALFWLLWFYLPVRQSAVVTVISEKSRQELIRYLGRIAEKVIVVPNTYDPAFTYQPKPFGQKQPILLQIGTALHKNLSRLIEAIEGLRCTLIIVGPLSDNLTAELINRQIVYENYVNLSQNDLVDLYVKCDMVTFMSTYEGFGMPILEANAVGRPVITSHINPMMDIGGAAACYVNPTNVMAIRQAILRICQDEIYRTALIRAGRKNAQNYTLEKVSETYMRLYDSFLQTKNGRK